MHGLVLQLIVYLIILFMIAVFCAAWLWYICRRPMLEGVQAAMSGVR